MGYEVFISYSSRDATVAQAVCAAIEGSGLRCWIAPRDITPGMDWAEAILAGIADCRVMVLVFSSHANLSPQIKREVERAVNRSMPILPFKIDQTNPSGSFEFFIMASHWLDASTPPIDVHFGRLTQSVRALLEPTTSQPKADAHPSALDPFLNNALRHCENYASIFANLSSFDDGDNLPRETCGISRHTCDLESERENQRAPNPVAPPHLFSEGELIDQLASRSRRRLWVLGGGGIGKTEFSKLCALRLAEKFREQPSTAVIPIRVELKSLDPSIACNSADRLLRNHLIPDEIEWIGAYLQAGRVAFILDGMDELRLDRQSFNGALLKQIQQRRECIFVVTSRGDSIEPELAKSHGFDRDSVHVLKPVTLEKATAYVESFFSFNERRELAAPLVKLLEDDATLQDLVRNSPLLLAMASQIYLARGQITSNPLDLIERGLMVMFERRRSRFAGTSDGLPEDAACLKAVSCLAAYSFLGRPGERNGSMTFTRQDGVAWLRENQAELASVGIALETDDAARRLILQLTPASGVMGWSSRDTITFSHRVLTEFFVARWVIEAGYPHWPYRDHAYTALHNDLDRQIADFFGDKYFSRELGGIRYWMIYLLERRKPTLLGTLNRWQQNAVTALGSAVPQSVYVPDEWLTTVVDRLLNAAYRLREIKSDELADSAFDTLVEEIGIDTTAKYRSPWNLLFNSSRRYFRDTLMHCCSVEHFALYSSPVAFALMPHLLRMFDGVRNAQGELAPTIEVWQFAQRMAMSMICQKYSETSGWGLPLTSLRPGFQWSETDKQTLVDCIENAQLPTLGFRLWDILCVLLANPPQSLNMPSLLRSLRARLGNGDTAEEEFVLTAMLLHSGTESESILVSNVADIFVSRGNENRGRQLGSSLRKFFYIRQLTARLAGRLCDLPEELLQAGRLSNAEAGELAAIIAESVVSSTSLDDESRMTLMARLWVEHRCEAAVLKLATRIPRENALFYDAKNLVVASLQQALWEDKDDNMNRLAWLKSVDPVDFERIRDRTIQTVEEDLKTAPTARNLAAQIFGAPKVREFIEFPSHLFSFVQSLLVQSIEEFGRGLANIAIWEQFEQHTPDWRNDTDFVSGASGFSEPSDSTQEAQFLALILGPIRKQTCDASELADRIVERLCKIGVEQDVKWVASEPARDVLRTFMLLAIHARTGKSLLDGDSVIKFAAARWGDDTEIRRACVNLVTQSVASAAHESVLELSGKALAEGWPGDHDVLRGLVEAGLGSVIVDSDEWARWMMFWEGEGSTAWLPECPSGFERVPVQFDSVRGSLVLCLRDDVRRGLPGDLAVEKA